ncbi:MAG TPA: hypothetical protein DDW27_14410 [Bacteroidales bacterium]|nr:hypothetical protein [Bacteroidales bacterium]
MDEFIDSYNGLYAIEWRDNWKGIVLNRFPKALFLNSFCFKKARLHHRISEGLPDRLTTSLRASKMQWKIDDYFIAYLV